LSSLLLFAFSAEPITFIVIYGAYADAETPLDPDDPKLYIFSEGAAFSSGAAPAFSAFSAFSDRLSLDL